MSKVQITLSVVIVAETDYPTFLDLEERIRETIPQYLRRGFGLYDDDILTLSVSVEDAVQ